jgi:hypothetical protein
VLAFRPGDAVTYNFDYSTFRILGSYGVDGGYYSGIRGDSSVLTLANPPAGAYSLVVKATYPEGQETTLTHLHPPRPDAHDTGTQRQRQLNTNGLPNTAAGLLADKQRAFFKVVVPDMLAGQPFLGWRLDLAQTQGSDPPRVPGHLAGGQRPRNDIALDWIAAIVRPYLTPGTWFVKCSLPARPSSRSPAPSSFWNAARGSCPHRASPLPRPA